MMPSGHQRLITHEQAASYTAALEAHMASAADLQQHLSCLAVCQAAAHLAVLVQHRCQLPALALQLPDALPAKPQEHCEHALRVLHCQGIIKWHNEDRVCVAKLQVGSSQAVEQQGGNDDFCCYCSQMGLLAQQHVIK